MSVTVKDLLAEANAVVPKITPDDAKHLITNENALVLDVRDPSEVSANGRVKGALNVSRGMLEFRADPDTPHYEPAFEKDRPIILYCASGGRAALGAKRLMDMGYPKVYNLGAFKAWSENGGDTERE